MTTARRLETFRLPDRPEREPDDMTSYNQLADNSLIATLRQYLGRQETTLITGDHYLCEAVARSLAGARYPDLLVAFDADLELYLENNGYIISRQGKPPDLVLEIASESTGEIDTGCKRRDYARMGIPEYWRFDETGQHHKTRLAGDRLGAAGRYHPFPIEETADGTLYGYSPALNLLLRWENGRLWWCDPVTYQPLPSLADEHAARIQAQARADQQEARADQQQARADQEQAARIQAQAEARREREAHAREREARLQAEARARELAARLENLDHP